MTVHSSKAEMAAHHGARHRSRRQTRKIERRKLRKQIVARKLLCLSGAGWLRRDQLANLLLEALRESPAS